MKVVDFRFRPNTPEPEEGWMGEPVRLGRSIEEADDLPPLPAPPAWTESKQRHREALKKLALGQKLSRGQSWQQTMWSLPLARPLSGAACWREPRWSSGAAITPWPIL